VNTPSFETPREEARFQEEANSRPAEFKKLELSIFARRLQGVSRSAPDGSRRAPATARALSDALLTMRRLGV